MSVSCYLLLHKCIPCQTHLAIAALPTTLPFIDFLSAFMLQNVSLTSTRLSFCFISAASHATMNCVSKTLPGGSLIPRFNITRPATTPPPPPNCRSCVEALSCFSAVLSNWFYWYCRSPDTLSQQSLARMMMYFFFLVLLPYWLWYAEVTKFIVPHFSHSQLTDLYLIIEQVATTGKSMLSLQHLVKQ